MSCVSYQQYTPAQVSDQLTSQFSMSQNILVNAEKFIPSNLFQTIYAALPNLFMSACPEQQVDFHSGYAYSSSNYDQTAYYSSNTASMSPSSEEVASEPESSIDDQRKKKGKNKAAVSAKKNWTKEEEDELILTLGLKYKNDWKRVAKQILKIRGRKLGPKKLKDHFKSLTKGSLPKRIKFTHEEDLLIAKNFEQFGADWAKIATYLPARSAMMIKNRYYSFIRKKNLVNNLLNELTNNQNLEAESSENSPMIKQENESEESEEATPFISYKEEEEFDSISKSSIHDILSNDEIQYKPNPALGLRDTYFSDFDEDCYYLFEQSFKQYNY